MSFNEHILSITVGHHMPLLGICSRTNHLRVIWSGGLRKKPSEQKFGCQIEGNSKQSKQYSKHHAQKYDVFEE